MRSAQQGRAFDGIICLGGEDWWYHNRGHFDFQIMRRLARDWPVLFVNSLGVRMPSPKRGHLFRARIARKLKSIGEGLVRVENGFWVFSPLMLPGRAGQSVSGWVLAPQIRRAAARIGIGRPLLWVHCPAGAALIGAFDAVATILQRTDRFEAFPEGDPELLAGQIANLKRAADLVVYASPLLAAEEMREVRRQLVVSHGVDLELFAAAADGPTPVDVAGIPRPRIGFVGGIDAHTFDPELFLSVAGRLPDCQFVLVGGCSLPEGWCMLTNVHHLGRKPYEQVAGYMAAMDVLIMPWNRSPWIAACNPVKLKEYLAVGRPVVTTDFAALAPWRDLVRTAGGAEAFAAAIRAALAEPLAQTPARARLATESWEGKTAAVRSAIGELGLDFIRRTSPRAAA